MAPLNKFKCMVESPDDMWITDTIGDAILDAEFLIDLYGYESVEIYNYNEHQRHSARYRGFNDDEIYPIKEVSKRDVRLSPDSISLNFDGVGQMMPNKEKTDGEFSLGYNADFIYKDESFNAYLKYNRHQKNIVAGIESSGSTIESLSINGAHPGRINTAVKELDELWRGIKLNRDNMSASNRGLGKTYNIRRNHAIRKRMAKFDPSSIGMGGNTTLDSLTLNLDGVGAVDMYTINTNFGPKLTASFSYNGIGITVTADMDGFFDFGKIWFSIGDRIFGDEEEVSIDSYKSTAEYVWSEEVKVMIDEGGIRKSSVRKGYETEGEGDDRREFLSVNLDDVGTVRLEYDPNYEGVVYKGGFEFHGIHFTIEIRPEMSMTISHNGNGSSVSQELYMTDNEDDMVGLANDMWSEFKTAMYIDAPIHKQESLPDTFTVELPQLGDVTMSLYNTTTSGKAYSGTFDYNTDSITIKTFVTDDYFDITIYDDTNLPGIHESTEDIPDPSFSRVKSGIRLFWTGNVWEKVDRAQKERNKWMSKSNGLIIKSNDGTDITNMTVREMVKRRVR